MFLLMSLNFVWFDDVFCVIVEVYCGFSDGQSVDFDVVLVLILVNYIGDIDVLCEVIVFVRWCMIEGQQQ